LAHRVSSKYAACDARGRGACATAQRDAGRISIALGQLTLAAWVGLLLAHDLAPQSGFGPAERAASTLGAAIAGAFGFVLPVVLGMFPRLAPGLMSLPRPTAREGLPAAAAGTATALVAMAWLVTGEPVLLPLVGAAASAAGATLIATVVRLARRPRRELPIAARAPFAAIRKPADLCLAAALLYLTLGGALFALAMAPALGASIDLGILFPGPLHLVTAGFIVLMVFGIGLRMFSAFSGRDAPPRAAWAIALLGVPAPAGIAWGLATAPANYALVAACGAAALAAACTFAATVLVMRANQRRPRAAWWLLTAAALMLVAGEGLGVLFGAVPYQHLALAPVHAQFNLLGFAALMIFGVLFEFSGGAPAVPGRATPGIAIAALWPAALALRLAGVAAGVHVLSALGALILAGSLVAAVWDAHPRRRRRPAPPPEGP
jgi:hypothetical protein